MKLNTIKIHYLIKLIVFWILFFAFFRLLFVIYHHAKIPDGKHSNTVMAFIYGLRLDLSVACFAAIIPYVLWSIQQFYKRRLTHKINLFFNVFLIILISLLSIANIKIYGEWGTLLNARALHYLLYPKEAVASISIWALSLLLFSSFTAAYIGIKYYRKHLTHFSYTIENKKLKVALIIIFPVLLMIGARGGLQLAPVNESAAYYSPLSINNHVATNNIWYLAHSILDANETKNPFLFTSNENAKKITAYLFDTPKDEHEISITKINKPNIIIIVLESWTADIIKALDGENNVTPYFDELQKEGILFTQMYGSGYRTDQGLVSILSGFPAQPYNSIITTPNKTEKIPSINNTFSKQGYQSSFYYGGESEFANIKSYLLNTHFQKIIDKTDFKGNEFNSKWGAHDEYVLQKQLTDLTYEKQPFFSVLLTLSTHEPFDVPMKTPFKGGLEEDQFRKAAYYTDQCLSAYFNKAKKQNWYANTLFVLVADHGHHLPKKRDMSYPEGRRITALLMGGALNKKLQGKKIDKICNQNDWPAILLSQLKLPHTEFFWSKDVLNKNTKEFAYYSNENSLGWITPQQNIIYSLTSNKVEAIQPKTQNTLNDSLLIQAKAFLQTFYQTYLDY
jgi:phosphoglycerol transferase MdoB-like AlkP superfamily enzyme